MKSKASGFSLIELLISTGILGVLALAISSAMYFQSEQMLNIRTSGEREQDHGIFLDRLRAILTASNLDVHSFIGDAASSIALARLAIPGYCADLTTTCPNDTAFLVGGRKRGSAMLPVICAIPAGGNDLNLILNLTNTGDMTYSVSGGNVTADYKGSSASTMLIDNRIFQLLISDQHALLVESVTTPATFDPLYDPSTGLYGNNQFANNPDCLRLAKPTDTLYSVRVSTRLLPFTGANQPTLLRFRQEIGKMPLFLTNADYYSIGRVADVDTGPLDDFQAGVFRCKRVSGELLKCTEMVTTVDGVEKVDFLQVSKAPFVGRNKLEMFGFHDDSCPDTRDCRKLSWTNPVAYSAPTETADALDPSTYTMIKTEAMHGLVVRLMERKKMGTRQFVAAKEFYVTVF